MGGGSFDSKTYDTYSSTVKDKSHDEIYKSREMKDHLNPYNVKVRESRDSIDNPKSTPIIVGLDVTGSMGEIAGLIAREGLGVLFNNILDRKPITNPHVMFMAIGDAMCDSAPLQVSQFEADNRIVEQLADIWLEGRGGGNNFESYHLPWYFAAFHTVHDSMEKRGKRGYLFTMGDEFPPQPLTPDQVKRVCGDDIQTSLDAKSLLELAQRSYNVFHIIIEQGNCARANLSPVQKAWRDLMGQHVISLSDYTKVAETIVSAIQVAEGDTALNATKGWGAGSKAVHEAVKNLPQSRQPKLLEKN